MPKQDPKGVGERSEGMVLAALLQKGRVLLQPFGNTQRYDLVIDDHGTFSRVQCKTGRLRDGAVEFMTSSNVYGTSKKRDYTGEVEFFGVYCPDNGSVYLVPVEDLIGVTYAARLRVDPTKNGWRSRRSAKDYEIAIGMNLSPELVPVRRKDLVRKRKQRIPLTKIKWPVDKELSDMVFSRPVTDVAKELGVSGAAVSRRCLKHGIELHPRGYWAKVYSMRMEAAENKNAG